MDIRGEGSYLVVLDELAELDSRLYAPDGDPWCRFGVGLTCLNGIACLNENHRRYTSVTGESSGED